MARHFEANAQFIMQTESEWLQNLRELCGDESSPCQELDFSQCNSPLTEKCKEPAADLIVLPAKLTSFPCDASLEISSLDRGQRWTESWEGHGGCCYCSCKCHQRLPAQPGGLESQSTTTSESNSCDQSLAASFMETTNSLLLPYPSMVTPVSPWPSSHDLSAAIAPLLTLPGEDSDSEMSVLLDRDHHTNAPRHSLPPPNPASIAVGRTADSMLECQWGHCNNMARAKQRTAHLEGVSLPSIHVESIPSTDTTPRRSRRVANPIRSQRHRTNLMLCTSSSDQEAYEDEEHDGEDDDGGEDEEGDEEEEYEEEYEGKCHQESASRPRRKASEQSRTILMDWLVAHQDHPYPTKREKEELARRTGMELKQIMHWMSNVRKRRFLPLICGKRAAESTVDVKFLQEFQKRMKR